MAAHGGARGLRVVALDRPDHGPVFGHRLFPGGFAFEVAAQARKQRPIAFVEQLRDDGQQGAVVAGLGDAQVEVAVTMDGQGARGDVAFHFPQGLFQIGHQGAVFAARGDGSEFTFDQLARPDDFQRAVGVVQQSHRLAGNDHDARAHAHFNQPLDFERDQRLSHGRPRHAHLQRQVAFGRQARAHREFAALDELAQLIGNLAVEPAGFDGLEGHEVLIW
ncbi:hypothetical protein D9M68_801140 [compost metagenome]